jgi:uncharacterized protein
MSLYLKIKQDQLQARKNRDAVAIALLTTLMGEAAMPGKNDGNRDSTDAEVTATIKKFVKNIDSLPAAAVTEASKAERILLESYLPKQLTEDELRAILTGQISAGGATMPTLQGFLKTNHAGQYDGKLATTLIKGLLA